MSGTTISGYVNGTVYLGSSSYSSPLTITNTGTVIGPGPTPSLTSVNAIQGTTASIQNDGTVMASASSGDGISLSAGGSIINTGTVFGSGSGIAASAGTLDVDNSGAISGGAYGVNIAYGTILNEAGGQIYGTTGSAIHVSKAGSTLTNYGAVTGGSAANGVYLYDSGSVINAGSIFGGKNGIYAYQGTVSVLNSGTISGGTNGVNILYGYVHNETGGLITVINSSGSAGSAVYFFGSDTLVNDGNVTGGSATIGVLLHRGGEIINAGSISGSVDAIYAQGQSTTLVTEVGSTIDGAVNVSASFNNLLELAAGSMAGTLNMGGSFTGFTTIAFDSGAAWQLEGTSAELAAGQTIAGFAGGDTLSLSDFAATAASYNAGVLTLTGASGAEFISFASGSGLINGEFILNSSGGGTDITLCFYAGTRIATPDGEVAVEELRAGDMVQTVNGARPVRWIGQSRVSLRFADQLRVLPIRVRAGALDGTLPRRDLLLSPDHALFLGGLLIQASALVNGVTILRDRDVPEEFSYYHVELETHELLLAEGTPAESFVDNAARMNFHNWDERTAPTLPTGEMDYPRVKSARQLPSALRERFAAARAA